jgi:predicted MPP superfamily phosphohydrolase
MKHKKVVTAIVILLALVGFSYYENNSIGNSIIPQRIFNRPDIVVVTLRSK